MSLVTLMERLGESWTLAVGGLLIGGAFGFLAQRSRFCLRSAVIEFTRVHHGGKLTVWLFAFSTALAATQGLAWWGLFDASDARQLATRGSLSGAAVGGALFGMGMILARGCSSRLLVLAAQGNLRAAVSVVLFAVVAQSAWQGALSPLREWVSAGWTVDGGVSRDLLARTGTGHGSAVLFGVAWLAAAVVWARRQHVPAWGVGGAIGVGLCIAAAWGFTHAVARQGFDPHPVQALSFTGPTAESLMRLLTLTGRPLNFDMGLMAGVVLGAFVAAALARELHLEGFHDGLSMRRYIAGAVAMGFGGMTAGGCAVGAGLSGAAVFSATAWVALVAMWGAAALTDWAVDQHPQGVLDQPIAGHAAPLPA